MCTALEIALEINAPSPLPCPCSPFPLQPLASGRGGRRGERGVGKRNGRGRGGEGGGGGGRVGALGGKREEEGERGPPANLPALVRVQGAPSCHPPRLHSMNTTPLSPDDGFDCSYTQDVCALFYTHCFQRGLEELTCGEAWGRLRSDELPTAS